MMDMAEEPELGRAIVMAVELGQELTTDMVVGLELVLATVMGEALERV
jgi:hypothetical protein